MVRLLINIFVLVGFLSACNQSGQKSEDLQINTSGIFNGITISYNDVLLEPFTDLGEYLLGSGPKRIVFRIRNNSLFPITQMGLRFDGNDSTSWSFEKDSEGLSNYPGATGTCQTTLRPAEVCNVVIQFETNIKGTYTQGIYFNYTNLVEKANRYISLSILAGNQASLVFDDDKINYWFGDKVGTSQTPVVERENAPVLKQTLNVTNAGDLKARNIKPAISNTCTSKLTKSCPLGQESAYSFTHNCPKELKHGESCQLEVTFKPLNQDPVPGVVVPELKNITFNSRLKLDYETSMYKTPGSLNGYFVTVSTNIEAIFETSIEKLTYENQILVGNRAQKTIKVNNRGYRAGYLLKLHIINPDGSLFGTCFPQAGVSLLECQANGSVLSLADFSFVINDKDNCMADASEEKRLIEVDNGCVFEVLFQPSTAYQTAMDFDFGLQAEFDSRWKDAEVIVKNKLFDVNARSLDAAKLVFSDFKFNGKALMPQPLGNGDFDLDLGRLALLSKNSYRYKRLTFKIKNIGGYPAENLVLKDGKNTIIPFKTDGVTTGVNLGASPYFYYKNVFITTDGCNNIQPTASCDVRIDFAPIHLGVETDNFNNMFDVIDPVIKTNSRKVFSISYDSGALYKDTSLLAPTPDFPKSNHQVLFAASLVMKAVMEDYTDPTLNLIGDLQPFTLGNHKYQYVILKNVGTQSIPYMSYNKNIATPATNARFKMIPRPSGVGIPNLPDCYPMLDFNRQNSETPAAITARLGAPPQQLAQDQSCVLSFKIETLVDNFTLDLLRLVAPSSKVLDEIYDRNPRLPNMQWWNYDFRDFRNFNFNVEYTDGDTSDPKGTGGNLQSTWGNLLTGGPLEMRADLNSPAKVVPVAPAPSVSAFLLRPQFTAPAFTLVAGGTQNAKTIPERRHYGPTTETTLNDTNITRAAASIVSITPGAHYDPMSDDYLFHGGTFEAGKTHNMKFSLANLGASSPRKVRYSITNLEGDSAFTVSSLQGQDVPLIPAADFQIKFAPTNLPGDPEEKVYKARFDYSYEDGVFQDGFDLPLRRLERSILIMAVAKKNAPKLETYLVDVQVEPQDNTVPEETYPAPVVQKGSTNEDPIDVNDVISLRTIKIPLRTANDVYVRKAVIFRNTGSLPLNRFSLVYRMSPTSITVAPTLPPSIKRELFLCNTSDPFTKYSDLTNICQSFTGTSLGVGKELRLLYTYKPGAYDIEVTNVASAFYEVLPGQNVAKNISFMFTPTDPAMVQLAERPSKTIKIKLGTESTVVSSQMLDFGEFTEMRNLPEEIKFESGSGLLKILRFTNTNATSRASFLRTYHSWLGITDKTAEPTYDANGYALIFQRNYASSSPRFQIYANRFCLVGDNNAPLARQQGFFASTSQPCLMKVHLFADLNYISKKLDINNGDEMTPNYVQLQYYNNERSSFANINIHFEGRLVPNRSLLPSGVTSDFVSYTSVKANSDRTASFKVFAPNPRNSSLGPIVGYRVYYSSNATEFADFASATAPYKDILNPSLDLNNAFEVNLTGLQMSRRYLARVVAIRQHTNYTRKSFAGLNTGFYLSEVVRGTGTTWGNLKFMIPPAHMFYDYDTMTLIDRNITGSSYRKYVDAGSDCSKIKEDVFIGTASSKYSLALITVPVWNRIVIRNTESSYNVFSKPHWLSGSALNFNTFFAPHASYNPSVQSNYVEEVSYFYYKGDGCGSACVGQQAAGASPLGRPNYNSLLFKDFPGAHPRCFLAVP